MAWSAIYVALAAVGIDVGWQPLPEGGYEYIIHLEPDALSSLRDGLEIHSQVPPFLRDFRVCRILVSNQAPPRLGEPEAAAGPNLHADQKPATPNPAAPQTIDPAPPELKPLTAQQAGGTMTFPPAPQSPSLGSPPAQGTPGATNPAKGPATDTANRPPLENPIADPFGPGHKPPAASPAPEKTPDAKSNQAVDKTPNKTPNNAPNKKPDAPENWIDPARAPNWLLGTALGLFVSLGGNAYLGWLAWGFRNRYERSIERLKQNLAVTSNRSVA